MYIPSDYIQKNRALWNKRTLYHFDAAFYDVSGFMKGNSSLRSIELDLLGTIEGQTILHLQCHFGLDTLSLARMGACATGVDVSDIAIDKARELARQVQLNASFICCDVYELPSCLEQQFDIVFSSYGTIGWLPDLDKWAQVVAHYMKPGGKFVFVEFHPVVWMFDAGFSQVRYSYFNKETIIETEHATYADEHADINMEAIGWNHSMDEVLQSLLDKGLRLSCIKEYDFSPYRIAPVMTDVNGKGCYQVQGLEGKLPLTYALVMHKP